MDSLSDPWLTAITALCLGIAIHQAIRRVEIDSKLAEILQLFTASNTVLMIARWQLALPPLRLSIALRFTLWVNVFFFTGLFSSIILYRAVFHRLRNFPGPFGAKITKFWVLKQAAKTLQWNEKVRELHREHGDFVRIGPREISVNRPSAIHAIYGPPSLLLKSPWYDQVSHDSDKCSLNGTRDAEDHRRRRRAWDRGLGVKALTSYSAKVFAKADTLVSQLAKRQDQAVNFTKWGFYYAFDIMGLVGLGTDFSMVDTGMEHEVMTALHGQMIAVGVLGTVPWLLSSLSKLPITGGFDVFIKFCIEHLDQKIKGLDRNSEPHDILSWVLMAQYEGDQSATTGRLALEDDTRLLIIAGSDTTAAVMANAFFLLAIHPLKLKKLQEYLDEAFPDGSADWTFDKAKRIPYLTHVVNETMRIKAPVSLGLPRLTPPEGMKIDEIYIPGDVIVSVPTHTIQLDSRYFENPENFLPERWEAISSTDQVPFLPFSRGAYSCAGKQLAMMELQTVISKVALAFDFRLASDDDDGSHFDKNWQDTFVLTLPELSLRFKTRK